MLSIQNYDQMNQMSNFKARNLPKAQKTLKTLYKERARYVQKEYPEIIAKLQDKLESGKISLADFLSQMDQHFNKLIECVKHTRK